MSQDLLVLPHEALRGHGEVAPALSDGPLGLLAGRRHPPRRFPHGQQGEGQGRDAATSAGRQRDGEPGVVNALHQRLSIFLAGFHGVSTKWLDHYLSWFMWLEQTRRSDADRLRTLSGQSASGSYEHTRRQMIERPQPFWDYWEKQTATSILV